MSSCARFRVVGDSWTGACNGQEPVMGSTLVGCKSLWGQGPGSVQEPGRAQEPGMGPGSGSRRRKLDMILRAGAWDGT